MAGFVTSWTAWMPGTAPGGPTSPLPVGDAGIVRGVSSVHSERSHDSRGSIAAIIAAARATDLDFVLLGDHPTAGSSTAGVLYHDSVLVVLGDEISLENQGRVLLFGLPATLESRMLSKPALGELLDAHSATAIVVHGRNYPDRGRWKYASAGPVQGWEVLDLSEGARRVATGPWGLYHAGAIVLGAVTGRASQSLARMDRRGFQSHTVAAYDSLSMRAPLTAMAGLNHHPKLELGRLLLPPYRPFFGTYVNHVEVPAAALGTREGMLTYLTSTIHAGRVHISVGEAERAAAFRLAATDGSGGATPMGGSVDLGPGLELRTSQLSPPGGRVLFRVVRDGQTAALLRGQTLGLPIHEPGMYRVEVHRYSGRIGSLFLGLRPWIFSNPIRVRAMPSV